MKKTIVLSQNSQYVSGMYFDAFARNRRDESILTTVRFVFFEHEGSLCRAMLSNIGVFKGNASSTSIIPAELRFPSMYLHAGLISPYGYRSNTISDFLDLMNHCFGSWEFLFVDRQTITIDDSVCEHIDGKAFISKHYGDSEIYTGQHQYHYSHSVVINKPKSSNYSYRVGVELEIEAKNISSLETIRDYRSNWFLMERDSSLNSYGVEIVTIPLLSKDARSEKFWTPLCKSLSTKAVSWDSSNCGLHVHIGREILGRTERVRSETLGKLLYLYHHFLKHSSLNTTIYGRSQGYHDRECKSDLAKAVEILGNKVLKVKKMRDAIDTELKEKSCAERYFDINILNTHTIEFRRGKGSLNPMRICAIVEYCELLSKYAKQAKWENVSYDNFYSYLLSSLDGDGALCKLLHSKGVIKSH